MNYDISNAAWGVLISAHLLFLALPGFLAILANHGQENLSIHRQKAPGLRLVTDSPQVSMPTAA